jgi:prophage antirepressor-like protein
MNELQIFKNEQFGQVRTLAIEGTPYCVGKDVVEILGYENQNRDIVRGWADEVEEKLGASLEL